MLAIGIVVDDAIVVVENVERWIEHGPVAARGGLQGDGRSHAAPSSRSRSVLTAVFVPVAFISGITGQFYRQFALTIAVSTLLSAFNSLTLSPALAALLLQPHAGASRTGSRGCSTCAVRLVLPAVQPRAGRRSTRLRRRAAARRAARGHRAARLRRPARA